MLCMVLLAILLFEWFCGKCNTTNHTAFSQETKGNMDFDYDAVPFSIKTMEKPWNSHNGCEKIIVWTMDPTTA